MIKKDISKILTKGSIKKRALLFFTNLAQPAIHKEEFLTESEKQKLYDSFKTDKEIKIYNKYRRIDQTMRYAMGFLAQYQFIYQEKITRAGAFVGQWELQQKAEELINLIIEELDPKREKKKELQKIINITEWFYPASTDLDKEGFIHIDRETPPFSKHEVLYPELGKLEKKHTPFKSYFDTVFQKAKESLIECKTIVEAISSFLEENEFKIEPYCLYLERIIEELNKEPILFDAKYSNKIMDSYKDRTIHIPSLMDKYLVVPKYEEIEIDKDFYKHIQATVLN